MEGKRREVDEEEYQQERRRGSGNISMKDQRVKSPTVRTILSAPLSSDPVTQKALMHGCHCVPGKLHRSA